MDVNAYDAQAGTIDVDDIATNSNNRIVLRRLQRNNVNDYNESLYIEIQQEEDGEVAPSMFQKGRMIWDGWDTSLVKTSIWNIYI